MTAAVLVTAADEDSWPLGTLWANLIVLTYIRTYKFLFMSDFQSIKQRN